MVPFDYSPASGSRWVRGLVGFFDSLPAVVLSTVVMILAGPQRWDEPRSQKVLTNIEFCVDVSGSMTASFGDGNRYDASMRAINEFLDFRSGDAFGLTFFGNAVLHWVPLTTDVSAFRCAPPFMRPSQIPSWFGGTEIGKALMACRSILTKREDGDRMIILVSDGSSSDLAGDRASEIARDLKKDNIVVYAVHVASFDPPDPIVEITSYTGGEVFNPGDPGALARVFETIDGMQETKMEMARADAIDDYEPWCLAGIGLLGLYVIGTFLFRYTPW